MDILTLLCSTALCCIIQLSIIILILLNLLAVWRTVVVRDVRLTSHLPSPLMEVIIVRNWKFPDNILLVARREEASFVYLAADKGSHQPTMARRN